MIYNALQVITEELNTFISKKEPKYRTKKTAVLSDLVNNKGEIVVTQKVSQDEDYVIVTLLNVEEETFGKSQLPHLDRSSDPIGITNPEIKINLYVLFTLFSDKNIQEQYGNCLRLLSYVILFFQYKHVFNHQNTPNLADDIENLIMKQVNLTFEQQNHLWGTLGVKYMPSVLYKLRMLTVREDEPVSGTLIEEIGSNLAHKT